MNHGIVVVEAYAKSTYFLKIKRRKTIKTETGRTTDKRNQAIKRQHNVPEKRLLSLRAIDVCGGHHNVWVLEMMPGCLEYNCYTIHNTVIQHLSISVFNPPPHYPYHHVLKTCLQC